MFATRLTRRLSIGAVIAAAACAHSSAPKGSVPQPAEAQAAAYGGWIELTYGESEARRRIAGELIAVSAESVWVVNDQTGLTVPTSAVQAGKLTAYAAQTGPLRGWMTAGTLATLSNGGFLIFTAPMWIIGGTVTVGGEVRSAERKHPPLTWAELAAFARFPQGMPPGIEVTALRSRTATGTRR